MTALGYVGVFLGSVALSLVFTPLALRFAVRRQILDVPGDHKSHESPIPYLGGIAIVGAFSLAVLVAAWFAPGGGGQLELGWMIGIALALAAVGLYDDLRGMGIALRFGLELTAAVAMWAVGVRVILFGDPLVDLPLTVLWIVGITNAFNLLDNMDGLSAGVAAVAAGGFFVIAATNGQFLVAALALSLAGCAVGFLRHNFHPATIYMGDAGSLFLGFLLAVIGIKLRFDAPKQVTFLVPILVLAVPLFDTALVTISRLRNGRSPFQGGRDHTSHRLVVTGLPIPVAVSVIYGFGVASAWLGLVLVRLDTTTAWMLAGFVGAVMLLAGVLLSFVPVYEEQDHLHRLVLRFEDEPNGGQATEAPDQAEAPDAAPATDDAHVE